MPKSRHLQLRQPAKAAEAAPRGHERRRSVRGASHGEPSRTELVRLILGTYAEMPGLTLHLHQAARLFGLRETTCRVVLSDLVEDGRLRQSADGQYRRATRDAV
jgi:hypothetical protein